MEHDPTSNVLEKKSKEILPEIEFDQKATSPASAIVAESDQKGMMFEPVVFKNNKTSIVTIA